MAAALENFQSSGLYALLYVGFYIKWSAEKAAFSEKIGRAHV